MARLALITAAILAMGAAAPDETETVDITCTLEREAPADAVAFLERHANCQHWGGEEPYDDERAAQIRAAVDELKCEALEADEAALRSRYDSRPMILAMIDRGKEEIAWPGCQSD